MQATKVQNARSTHWAGARMEKVLEKAEPEPPGGALRLYTLAPREPNFLFQCIDRWQQVVNTLGWRRRECLWFTETSLRGVLLLSIVLMICFTLNLAVSPFCPLWDCFLYRVHFSTFCFFHLKFLLLISLIWHTMPISRLLTPFYPSGKQRFCDWNIIGVWPNAQCSASHKQAIIGNLCIC